MIRLIKKLYYRIMAMFFSLKPYNPFNDGEDMATKYYKKYKQT